MENCALILSIFNDVSLVTLHDEFAVIVTTEELISELGLATSSV